MSKPFLTYEQQIDKLKNEKNLLIHDEEYAVSKLKQLGYFKLIGGYKHLFKNKTTKKYKDNTCFDDIVELYSFDEKLREITLKYLLKVEQQLRSLISYYFCQKYGNHQTAYLTKTNYNYTTYENKQDVDKLINIIQSKYINNNTDYSYINHSKSKHGNLPLWVLINALTFGNISKMYSLLPQTLQISISRNYSNLNEKQLAQTIRVLTKFRNACAHGERLFSYTTNDTIPNLPIHQKLNIKKKGSEYIYGKNDLFAVVISLRYLLPKEVFSSYKKELSTTISSFCKKSIIPNDEVLHCMGFPENWASISKFRKI